MSTEFDGVRAKGIALIKKKGRPIQILIGGDAAPSDPNKPWNVAKAAPTIVSCTAVVIDFATKRTKGIAEKTCYVPGDCGLFEIDETMRIKVLAVVGSSVPDKTFAIDTIIVYEPDGIPIGWQLRLVTWPQTSQAQPTKF